MIYHTIEKSDISKLKGMAIVMMLLLHLFANANYELYDSVFVFRGIPIEYYLGLYSDACVAIFCFASGFGLFCKFQSDQADYSVLRNVINLVYQLWLVMFLFLLILVPLFSNSFEHLGTIQDFVLNLSTLSNSYNGAWWFVRIYIMLALTSKFIFIFMERFKSNIFILLSIFIAFYTLAYIYRIKIYPTVELDLLSYLLYTFSLYLMCLFPFIIGVLFAKHDLINVLAIYRNFKSFAFFILISSFFFHCFFQTLYLAAFNSVIIVVCFMIRKKNSLTDRFWFFMSRHSTNVWLVHMFFYLYYFQDLVYYFDSSIFVFFSLLILSLISSYVLNMLKIHLKFFGFSIKKKVS